MSMANLAWAEGGHELQSAAGRSWPPVSRSPAPLGGPTAGTGPGSKNRSLMLLYRPRSVS